MKWILPSCKANLLAKPISKLCPNPLSIHSSDLLRRNDSGVFLFMAMKLLVINGIWDEKSKLFSRHFARMNYEPD